MELKGQNTKLKLWKVIFQIERRVMSTNKVRNICN